MVVSAEPRKSELAEQSPSKGLPSGLYGMVDTSANHKVDHIVLGRTLLDAGVRVLQVRMKNASVEEHLAVLPALQEMCIEQGAQLLVNDHLEVARHIPGVGIHLGQDDVNATEARRVLGDDVLIGLSTHNLRQVRTACSLPIDYIGYGPIFTAEGKHRNLSDRRVPHDPVGLASLKQAITEATVPVVAIGGIDLERLPLLIATGVHAVAAISAVTSASNPLEAARAMQRSFDCGNPSA